MQLYSNLFKSVQGVELTPADKSRTVDGCRPYYQVLLSLAKRDPVRLVCVAPFKGSSRMYQWILTGVTHDANYNIFLIALEPRRSWQCFGSQSLATRFQLGISGEGVWNGLTQLESPLRYK